MVQGHGWCSTKESYIGVIKERLKHICENINVKQFCDVLKEVKMKVQDVYWLFYVVTERNPIVVKSPEEIIDDFNSFLSAYEENGRTNFISYELICILYCRRTESGAVQMTLLV